MKPQLFLLLTTLFAWPVSLPAADPLESGFTQPPEQTKPWCYWYWITDNISREGITKDLEAMKRVGISQAFIGNIYLDDVKHGTVKALTDEWWGMVEHAIREGGRIGVDVGMFNCPGWSQSGGPWIKPSQAMRYVASTERRVTGPQHLAEKLAAPAEPFQDVAVLAFPAPREDADTIATHSPRIACTPAAENAQRLCDGDRNTAVMFPKGAAQGSTPFVVDLEVAEAFTARSLLLYPAEHGFAAQCELQSQGSDGAFHKVSEFPLDRSNTNIHVGFLPFAPVAVSFPAETARHFRLVVTNLRGRGGLAEIELSGGARLERFIEKQLAKMHPTPLPMWDTYMWPHSAEPEDKAYAVPPKSVLNLSDKVGRDGILKWDVPPGDWIILRTGMTPTGTRNAPASPEGGGLEVDKMNRADARAHFDAYIGKLLQRMPKSDRKAFKYVIADSYEMGSQNWTDGLETSFRKRYGYDPRPWLPVLTGRLVGSAEQSDRFLWDLRRLVADRVAYDYVGGLRDECHRHGLRLWLENYGHWGYPAEFLQYGGQTDEVSGEFWSTGDLGSIELRCASSAAHTYGKPIVHAEAFTSGELFQSTPWSLKRRGDWALTEGINHWVLHVYIHQPWDDRRPGVNAWFSTEFNRNNTWFEQSRAWIDYYRRCDYLLQQGRPVADVAYFIGEDTPKMTGARNPALPPGYDFDYINAEVIEQRLKVKGGRLVLPDGVSYRVLVLPKGDTMRPELLEKIRDLVKAGGSIVGAPPSRSPSLHDYPECDARVKRLANTVWSGAPRVFRDQELQPVLDKLGVPPDVTGIDPKQILWKHRSSDEAELYFLSNQSDQSVQITPRFRVSGKAPELWDPAAGSTVKLAVYEPVAHGTCVPLQLAPRGSAFVVFRPAARSLKPVVELTRDGSPILTTASKAPATAAAASDRSATNFTMALWVRPAADIELPKEATSGVFLNVARNDAVFPPHGASAFGGAEHACAGISVGRNGVCVYEHSGDYFAPLLVQPATLGDWTHVAVVYQNGTPTLYLNGEKARQGLKSTFTVHSGLSVDASGGGHFQGSLADLRDYARVLSAGEVAALSREKPAPPPTPGITSLTRVGDGKVEAKVSIGGKYTAIFADKQSQSFDVPPLPAPLQIPGPWEVRFPANMDVPERVVLGQLIPLNEHANPAVRFFSGTATYKLLFRVPATHVQPGQRLMLDLGRVEAVAELSVNGRDQGVLWKKPFISDITDSVKPGMNELQVRVTGTWRNRLIGQSKYPEGFVEGQKPQFEPWLGVKINVKPDEAPAPFGLIGPVQLFNTRQITLDPAGHGMSSGRRASR